MYSRCAVRHAAATLPWSPSLSRWRRPSRRSMRRSRPRQRERRRRGPVRVIRDLSALLSLSACAAARGSPFPPVTVSQTRGSPSRRSSASAHSGSAAAGPALTIVGILAERRERKVGRKGRRNSVSSESRSATLAEVSATRGCRLAPSALAPAQRSPGSVLRRTAL